MTRRERLAPALLVGAAAAAAPGLIEWGFGKTAESGTAFDARCVDALDVLLARELGTAPAGAERSSPSPAPVPAPAPAY